MKFFLINLLILWLCYEIVVHLYYKIKDVAPDTARHRVNNVILKIIGSTPEEEKPFLTFSFTEPMLIELGTILKPYFNNICFKSSHDNRNGTFSIEYTCAGIVPKYATDVDTLKQIIGIDAHNFLLKIFGYEVPLRVAHVSNSYLHILLAYSNNGLQELNSLSNKCASQTLFFPKSPKNTFVFHEKVSTSILTLGIDYGVWQNFQIFLPKTIDLKKFPHILITGMSGSGKSYALTFYVNQLLHKRDLFNVWFNDFKASQDFKYLATKNIPYATGEDVYQSILDYYTIFKRAKDKGILPSKNQILIIDEYPAFMSFLQLNDKKKFENIKGIIAELLMLGRDVNGVSFNIIITAQRPDASKLFSDGVRDNFHTYIALGNLTSEAKGMISSTPSELPNHTFKQGEGIIKIAGKEIESIIIPEITNLHSV